MLGCLLGSQALTWLEPRTVSEDDVTLLCFAWLLRFSHVGANLSSTPAYELWLTDEGTESL
jgi:hypothetical protein